jgi:hypothetical protein
MAIALPPVVSSFCATHHRMQSVQNIDNNTSLVHELMFQYWTEFLLMENLNVFLIHEKDAL